jgi:hypothetical protein
MKEILIKGMMKMPLMGDEDVFTRTGGRMWMDKMNYEYAFVVIRRYL